MDEPTRVLYDALRALARAHLARSRHAPLSPTDLVHEGFVRLAKAPDFRFLGESQFLALASRVLRQVLVDHVRRQQRRWDGDDRRRITLTGALTTEGRAEVDLLELHEALQRLAELDPGLSRLVELRFLGGLTMQEAAAVLGTSPRVLRRDWELARAWLKREMAP